VDELGTEQEQEDQINRDDLEVDGLGEVDIKLLNKSFFLFLCAVLFRPFTPALLHAL
jgi:hypothetical protein